MIRVGKLGIIRRNGKDMAQLRQEVFERDKFRCCDCGKLVSWDSGHLAHIKSRGAGGSDVELNLRTLCALCHAKEHNAGGKPCPSKPRNP